MKKEGLSSHSNTGSIHDAIELGQKAVEQSLTSVVDAGQSLTYDNAGYTKTGTQPLVHHADANDDDDHVYRRHRQALIVQGITIFLICLLFVLLFVLISVTSATYDKVLNYKASTSVTTVYTSIGLPGYEGYAWADVEAAAAGDSVNFYCYSASLYDAWIDDWLTPRLSSTYDITMVRHPLTDTGDAVSSVINQIQQGYGLNNGTIDLIWINGENFAKLKNLGYAYGPWASKTPNAANFDFDDEAVAYDFGLETSGYEMPYNGAQVVFIANEKYVNHTDINTISKLIAWVKGAGKGKFTYAAPCASYTGTTVNDYDYTGSAFIRHVFYAQSSYSTFLGSFSESLYETYAPGLFKQLRELEPYLYSKTGFLGDYNTYPTSNDIVDSLITSEDIWVTLAYDPGHATAQIQSGVWPSTVTSFVLTSGTIGNTNFILIPENAKHKLAAVVTADFIASAQAMFSRAQPEELGALQVYDSGSTNFESNGWNDAFDYIDRPSTTPSKYTLDAYKVGELTADYINRIQLDFCRCVTSYTSGTYSWCG